MDSLIGVLPERWLSIPLGDVCEVTAGPGGHRLSQVTAGDVPVVAPRNIVDNRILRGNLSTVNERLARELGRYRLRPGDVVCVRTGTLGRHALAHQEHAGWLIGTGCLRIRANAGLRGAFLRYYLDHPAVTHWLSAHTVKTTVPSLSADTLRALPVALPPEEAQLEIVATLQALDEKIALHEEISRTTGELKEAVLPRLFAAPQR